MNKYILSILLIVLINYIAFSQQNAFKWRFDKSWTVSGTDTYTATLPDFVLAADVAVKFNFTNTNTTVATLAINGGTAKPITKKGATALSSGDLGSGHIIELQYDGTRWQIAGSGGTGSSGITIGTTAITSGTTTRVLFNDAGVVQEDAGLIFDKTNDALTVGVARMHTRGSQNTFIGQTSGNFTLSGATNTGMGYLTLNAVNGAFQNVAIGGEALSLVISGAHNSAVGAYALRVTTGSGNSALGNAALSALVAGDDNIAIGDGAAADLTSGSNNIIIGSSGTGVEAQSNTGSNQLTIQNSVFGVSNSGSGTTVSTGDIGIYQPAPTYNLHITGNSGTNNNILLVETLGGTDLVSVIETGGLTSTALYSDFIDLFSEDDLTIGSSTSVIITGAISNGFNGMVDSSFVSRGYLNSHTIGSTFNFYFGFRQNPTDALTYYAASSNEGQWQQGIITMFYAPIEATITGASFVWNCNGGAGSNESVSMYVVTDSGATNTLIETIGDTNQLKQFNNYALDIDLSQNDDVTIKVVCPTWTTNPTGCSIDGYVYFK